MRITTHVKAMGCTEHPFVSEEDAATVVHPRIVVNKAILFTALASTPTPIIIRIYSNIIRTISTATATATATAIIRIIIGILESAPSQCAFKLFS